MMRRAVCALGALLLCLAAGLTAEAQSEQKSPFGVPLQPGQSMAQKPAPEVARSILGDLWSFVLAQQQRINRELAAAVKQIKTGNAIDATLMLAFLAFTYGVLHAAGPGHGKAVISSYVLANEKTVRRGIMLSFLAAFIQAVSAIAVVGVLAILLNATSLTISATEKWIETLSWGFVALVGVWLLYGQIAAIFRRRAVTHLAQAEASTHAPSHANEHARVNAHAGCVCGHDHHHQTRGQQHLHAADGSCCGHAHMPDPSELEGPLSWGKALAIALSVGIRPCTGAILVMIFALSQGLFIAGVFATFAMALGTAVAVSVLASLAVGSRELATRMAGGAQSSVAGAVATGAGLLGAGLVLAMGAAFFAASLGTETTAPL